MHPVLTIFLKEIRDGRRDRRAVMSALIFPIMGPGLVYMMMTAMIQMRSQAFETTIPVTGMEHAPALVQWLREHNVRLEAFSGDARAAVRNKKQKLVLIIPDDYQKRYGKTQTAVLELVHDGSRTDSQAVVSRIRSLIRRYSSQIAGLRLILRGVSPEVMQVVDIQDIDIASRQQRAATALNFIPMYIMLAAFVSGMGLAVDASAGERERKSLEPLLINPVDRLFIVIGKWLAASVFSSVGMILTALLCITAMLHVPLEELGLTFSITPLQVALIIAGTFPLAFLATSMQLLVGIFAKSFKDAQSYLGLLMLVPVVPAMLTLLYPVAAKTWMFAVPILGQQLLLVDVIGAKAIPAAAYFLSAASCLLAGFALVVITARLFGRESIVTS